MSHFFQSQFAFRFFQCHAYISSLLVLQKRFSSEWLESWSNESMTTLRMQTDVVDVHDYVIHLAFWTSYYLKAMFAFHHCDVLDQNQERSDVRDWAVRVLDDVTHFSKQVCISLFSMWCLHFFCACATQKNFKRMIGILIEREHDHANWCCSLYI